MNKLRVPFIKKSLEHLHTQNFTPSKPLRGSRILDVGCGGGILSEVDFPNDYSRAIVNLKEKSFHFFQIYFAILVHTFSVNLIYFLFNNIRSHILSMLLYIELTISFLIGRKLEDMNFMFSWQELYLTRSLRSLVGYSSCHSNIYFISSRHRVISSMYLILTQVTIMD